MKARLPPGWVRLPEAVEAVLLERLATAQEHHAPLRARSTELRARPLRCVRGEAVLLRGVDHGTRPPRELRWIDVDGHAVLLPAALEALAARLPLTLEGPEERADWVRVAGAAAPDVLGGVVVESPGELRFQRRPSTEEHAAATRHPAPIEELDAGRLGVVVATTGALLRLRVHVTPEGKLTVETQDLLHEGPVCRKAWVH